ncbi:unnamed protein product [Urochloa humidicola]
MLSWVRYLVAVAVEDRYRYNGRYCGRYERYLVLWVDLTGRRSSPASYPPLPPATNDRPYPGPLWCVVSTDKGPVNETAVAEQVAAACTDKAGLCDAVRPGGACYLPNTVAAHASYVFSAHWNSFSEDYGGCYFGGLAVETTVDPSHGSCRFPSIRLK